jgi:hypothetical protein
MQLDFRYSTPSTFLIPESLIAGVQRHLENQGGQMCKLLRVLLRTYRIQIVRGAIRCSRHAKTEYQSPGHDLQRITFRPDNQSWLELGQLANFLGVSRCLMFIILLKMEMGQAGVENVGTTTKSWETYRHYHSIMTEYCDIIHIFMGRRERHLRTKPLGKET